jgi:REP element-mobilizing transposase RayT
VEARRKAARAGTRGKNGHPTPTSERLHNAMSYTQLLYHIVFSTKNREATILEDQREALYRYIWGIIKNSNGHLFRLNGTSDHVHLLVGIHPTMALADFVKTVKANSTRWAKHEGHMPSFAGWQAEYAAFTKSHEHKDLIVRYIKDQQEHHRILSFAEELKRLLAEEGIACEAQYLE